MLSINARAAKVGFLTLVIAGAFPLAHAAAETCAPDQYTESGTCAAVLADPPLNAYQRSQRAGKAAALAALGTAPETTPATPSTGPSTYSTEPDPGSPWPTDYQLKEVQDMRIFKEGEGNGRKSYTCGPSATRNMVAAMYRRKTGVWKDFTEQKFAEWEGTTTNGTARANIAKALNAHFSQFGSWTTSRPANAAAYLNVVRVDTFQYHQSVIANIDTEFLPFFAGHKLDHFDFVYGYYKSGSTNHLRIGEEWDPAYIYGASSYNPYGKQHATLASAFTAVTNTSYHGIVS